MPYFPKARKAGFTLAILTALILPGCCTCQERYDPFLGQLEENLRDDIRPKYEAALKASNRPADLMKNDLGLVDNMISAIKRIRTSSPQTGGDE